MIPRLMAVGPTIGPLRGLDETEKPQFGKQAITVGAPASGERRADEFSGRTFAADPGAPMEAQHHRLLLASDR